MPKVLVTRLLPEPARELLYDSGLDVVAWEKDAPAPPRAWILENVAGVDGALIMGGDLVRQHNCSMSLLLIPGLKIDEEFCAAGTLVAHGF
jgi:hypothetical protein